MPSGGQNKGQRSFPLTAEQIQREYVNKDASMAEAAKSLGCSVKILWQACKDHGITGKSFTRGIRQGRPIGCLQLKNHAWLREQLSCHSLPEIAETLGITLGALSSYVYRHGFRVKSSRVLREEGKEEKNSISKEALLSIYFDTNADVFEACERLNCSPEMLYDAIALYGLGLKDSHRASYVTIWHPEHPHADKSGNVKEHRLVAEKMIGRYLTDDEHVHHINHIRNDNRPENLIVMNAKEHMSMHRRENAATKKRYGTNEGNALHQRLVSPIV